MPLLRRIRIALRGEVSARTALLEAGRRGRAALERRRERAMLERARDGRARTEAGAGVGARASGATGEAAMASRLCAEFARMDASQLLEHFRTRATPRFLPGFDEAEDVRARLQRELFPRETAQLLEHAREIAGAHRWPLLGFGVREFGAQIDWLRDPLSGARWPLRYHADLKIFRGDGSDLRVLWELNRFAHLVVLARAYALSGDARLAEEFFAQIESWREQNPLGYGANWHCAMEVALRAMNLLAAFRLFRRAPELTAARLAMLLTMFDEHGAHIRRNLEFSHIATGNHYLSDIAGLLWLGVCLPELRAGVEWREFALREMLREMEKQVLADGANGESSTGYHRLVLELFLYSFILCRANHIEIEERYWRRLRAMFDYLRAYLRPDGRAPLVGDTDSGQVLPVARRAADDHAYLLALGAALFDDSRFKIGDRPPEELLWIAGREGVERFSKLALEASAPSSQAFAEAGVYIMREGDLYMLFNATDAGLGGRGSHGHNDALSVEVAACGASLISDAGTYLYTADFDERHKFRSTAYHSTVEVDGAEQNTTEREQPFIIGNEAAPRLLDWTTTAERDCVTAEHDGYKRLARPVTHRRSVVFDKRERHWLIRDALLGEASEHVFRFRFHAAPEAAMRLRADGNVEVCDKITNTVRLLIVPLDAPRERQTCALEARWSSRDYGAKTPSVAACWTITADAPLVVRWLLLPICDGEDESARMKLVESLQTRC